MDAQTVETYGIVLEETIYGERAFLVIEPKRILIFQTAFLGDVILTLPMIQLLHHRFPAAQIDVVTTPSAAKLLLNHPAIVTTIQYDKRNLQSGLKGILALSILLGRREYDLAIAPHRSLRTSMILWMSGVKERIGFSNATGSFLYNHRVRYEKSIHEIDRNISLLQPLGIANPDRELPKLYPSKNDSEYVNRYLFEQELLNHDRMIAMAPGSVWSTKRWPLERFAQTAVMLAEAGYELVIVGGREDEELGKAIVETARHKHVYNATGRFSLLQSAQLIGRCKVLITNDSAPLHMAVAMRTPVAAIFGATVPAFGFGPYGDHDIVVETKGLECRPCAIHGGNRCPIGTFVCMKNIEAETVYRKVERLLSTI